MNKARSNAAIDVRAEGSRAAERSELHPMRSTHHHEQPDRASTVDPSRVKTNPTTSTTRWQQAHLASGLDPEGQRRVPPKGRVRREGHGRREKMGGCEDEGEGGRERNQVEKDGRRGTSRVLRQLIHL